MKTLLPLIRKYSIEISLLIFSLAFSSWLMFHTFSYSHGNILIATKAWSDFSANIPLIRSFSFGSNFPPQYPLFPGQPIRYHFIFYMLAGFLEKIGIRIDYALNILSIIGFCGLLMMLYFLGKLLFKSKAVGVLSALLFLFNGSLSFLYFFHKYPLSRNTMSQIVTNQQFPSFGPYDSGIVSAFWNLNIYTNQRHLAFAHGLSLGLIFILISFAIQKKKMPIWLSVLLGIGLGMFFFFHIAVFLMTTIVLCIIFIFFPALRLPGFIILFIAGICTLPQYFYYKSASSSALLTFTPGYLIHDHLNVINFFTCWIANLGLHFFLIPLGFIIAPKTAKKIFLAILPIFFIGNLFQFSPEMAANHKFFSYFILIGEMFSAYFLVWLWKKSKYIKPLVLISCFFLIFSGLIDFFPVYNDNQLSIADYPQNPSIAWIMKNTSPASVFLNTAYIFDNASIAGRKIFFGWPYFSWSAGYDTNTRGKNMGEMLGATDKISSCRLLKHNNISYIEINQSGFTDPNVPHISSVYSQKFSAVYHNDSQQYTIYDVAKSCNL